MDWRSNFTDSELRCIDVCIEFSDNTQQDIEDRIIGKMSSILDNAQSIIGYSASEIERNCKENKKGFSL